MNDSKHDFLVKLIALFLGLWGLVNLMGGAGEGAGLLAVVAHWVVSLFMIVTAIGFWRYEGWAYLVVSIGLLVGWFVSFVRIVVALDEGAGGLALNRLIVLLAIMAGIAYLGRWSMERRFRPHLDR